MRFVATSLAVIVVVSGCATPTVGDLPDTPSGDDDDSINLPDRQSPDGGQAASSGGPRSETTPTPTKPTISITMTGTGTGSIASTPGGVACLGTACGGAFVMGTTVTLLATPAAGSVFAGWSGGGCAGPTSCAPIVNANVQLTAQFETFAGTWSGNYANTRPNGACTFTNQGTMSLAVTAGTGTFPTTAKMDGFEIRNLGDCSLQSRQPGQAKANLTVSGVAVTGTLPIGINGIGGTLDFPFTATISGTTLNGKWTCANCTGTFTLTKQVQ